MKESIQQIYHNNLSKYKQIQDEANFIIDNMFGKSDIKIHSIHSRIKSIDSLQKKAEDSEIFNTDDVFQRINDIVGLRIICLFISDIDEIIKLVKENFDILHEDNKLDDNDLSSFGYLSVHFHCKLKKEFKGPRYDDIKDMPFEIQIRTISMDAWANISHYLDYKTEIEIPTDLKKDFFALSGLFYVADTHFEMFFKNKKEKLKNAKANVQKNVDIEINFESLTAYVNNKFQKRELATKNSISKLTQELDQAGYKMISDLDNKLNAAFNLKAESQYQKNLNRVGIVRLALKDYDPKYKAVWDKLFDLQLEAKKRVK